MDGATRILLAALASALAAGALVPAAGAAQAGPASVAPDGPIMCCPA